MGQRRLDLMAAYEYGRYLLSLLGQLMAPPYDTPYGVGAPRPRPAIPARDPDELRHTCKIIEELHGDPLCEPWAISHVLDALNRRITVPGGGRD
jgi:hypothetical protein